MGTVNKSSKFKVQNSKLFILHGWTTSIDKWSLFLDSLEELNIRIKIPSIPGLTKKVSRAWTLEDYVSWLKKQVGTEKVILLGHSNGGRIAIAFTAKYPNNVNKLILIDSAGIYHNELPIRIKRELFKGLATLGKKITIQERLRSYFYKLTGESDYKNATPLQRRIMTNLIYRDLTPILEKIKTPALIVWGQNDRTTPLADGNLMHKLIKYSKLKIIKGAKHCPHYTHPKEVAKIIREYL